MPGNSYANACDQDVAQQYEDEVIPHQLLCSLFCNSW
jgi:hypothetical protein